MAEWTQKEQAQAQEQVIAETRKIGGTYCTTAIEFACQRNRMIAAAKDAKERLACEYIAGAYKSLNLAIAACTEGK